MTVTHHQKHQAGRHLVVGQAFLHGYQAELVGAASLVRINGKEAQVQVAAQGAWQIADVYRYVEASIGLVVLVDVRPADPAYYIVTGDEVRELVRRRHAEFMSAQGGTRPRNPDSRHSKIELRDVQDWRDRWPLFD